MSAPSDSWRRLFATGGVDFVGTTARLYAVHRGGEPFLLLPAGARAAVRALDLYPAQTSKARLAKRLLAWVLRLHLSVGLERIQVAVSDETPFARFLSQTVSSESPVVPTFALLAGNPRVEGRRFVMLLFNENGDPVTVVKAGVSETARRLLAKEETFLRSTPPGTPGVPVIRHAFEAPDVRAFALDFFPGQSPRDEETRPVAELLGSWVDPGRQVAMKELHLWRRLLAASGDGPLPARVMALSDSRFCPAITHGDFAPWNVKVSHGTWTALDWERGELVGIPGWDWFHFVMQPAVLVRHETTDALGARFEKLLASPEFVDYARRASIVGDESALALAYLAFCTRVIKQTEGLDRVAQLERALVSRWS